jgi:pilus assembly protein CpaB
MGKRKSFMLLGVAVAIALVTSFLIYRMLPKQTNANAATVQTQPVAVALTDLGWGKVLAKEEMKTVPYPKDYVPPGSFSDPNELVGRVLLYPVKASEPIFESRLAPRTIKTGGVAAVISAKKRAVAVKVDKIIGVAGFISAGNRVDVLVTLASGKISAPVTKTVLENVLVLAVGPDLEKKGKEPSPTDVITLEVTPEEAEKLALAATEGKLQMALRNYNDNEDVVTKGITVPTLLASYGSESPQRTAQTTATKKVPSGSASAKASAPRERPAPTVVEMVKGTKVTEVKFERSE